MVCCWACPTVYVFVRGFLSRSSCYLSLHALHARQLIYNLPGVLVNLPANYHSADERFSYFDPVSRLLYAPTQTYITFSSCGFMSSQHHLKYKNAIHSLDNYTECLPARQLQRHLSAQIEKPTQCTSLAMPELVRRC